MTHRVQSIARAVLGVALAAVALCNCAQAQSSYSWTNGGGGASWTTVNNWSGSSSYPGNLTNSDTAFFSKTSLTGAISISTPITLGALLMGSSNTTTIGGSTISLSNGGDIILGTTGKVVAQVISAPVTLLGSGTIGSNNAVSGGAAPAISMSAARLPAPAY